MKPYLWVRADGFYTLELPDDAAALSCVPCNPGTLRVENILEGTVIYDAAHAEKGRK